MERKSGRRRESDDALGQEDVECAVGSGDHVADAAEVLEEDLLRDDLPAGDLDAQQLLGGE